MPPGPSPTAEPAPPPGEGEGSRARRKRQTRQALEAAAWRLFTRQGYERTTTAQVAAAAGVSERTFFRYYASKEDVLLGEFSERLDQLAQAFAARPAPEPPLVAIQRALLDLGRPPRRVAGVLSGRLTEAPPVAARILQLYARAEATLAATVLRRLGVDPTRADLPTRLYATVTARAAMGALRSVLRLYRELERAAAPDPVPASALRELVDQAFGLLQQGCPPPDGLAERSAKLPG